MLRSLKESLQTTGLDPSSTFALTYILAIPHSKRYRSQSCQTALFVGCPKDRVPHKSGAGTTRPKKLTTVVNAEAWLSTKDGSAFV